MEEMRLLIFTVLEPETNFLIHTLKSIFKTGLEIERCTEEEVISGTIPPSRAVMVSTEKDLAIAREHLSDRRIIMVDRMLTYKNIEGVISLPEGKEVVVVTYPRESAIETVQSLYAMGVNHLKLIPYWLGCDVDLTPYDTVVYPGFREYVPEQFEHYIDIGYRHLSFATLFEVIHEYGLSSHYSNDYYEEIISKFVEKNYRLSLFLNRSKTMEKNFRWICDMSKDGILCLDARGQISICNPTAARLLALDPAERFKKDIEFMAGNNPELHDIIVRKAIVSDLLVAVNGEKTLINTHEIDIEDEESFMVRMSLVEAIRQTEIQIRKKLMNKGFVEKYHFSDIKGKSQILNDLLLLARRYAASDLNVMITGNSGTGKELFAQAIHNASERKNAPFVAINFAALPETLAESELFGYEEGAFTGALKGGKEGLFEMAHGGTLFLDEIGDASLSVQARLLRVLEERSVMRIGSSKYIPVDVRVICATNKNLNRQVEVGLFRSDLMYRIDVLPLTIPDLKARKEDIAPLMESMFVEYRIDRQLSEQTQSYFQQYDWPGNIRELKTAIQYLSVIEKDPSLSGEEPFEKFVASYFQGKKRSKAAGESGENPSSNSSPSREEREHFFLMEIMKANGADRRIGRNSLLSLALERGMDVSETNVRQILASLKERGLIVQGKTKQGIQITEKGEDFLAGLGDNPDYK